MATIPTQHDPPLAHLWWLAPVWPFVGIVASTMIAAWLQSDEAFLIYGAPKYIRTEHLYLAAAVIGMFSLGCYLASGSPAARASLFLPLLRSRSVHELQAADARERTIDTIAYRWFLLATLLTLVGYAAWLAVGLKNGFRPAMFLDILRGSEEMNGDVLRRDYFPTIPGVTTCTQFGVPATLLGAWLFLRGQTSILWPLLGLAGISVLRAIGFNERSALLELIFPSMFIVMRMWMLGWPMPARWQQLLRIAPIVSPILLVLFFGGFEYFRSWRYYQDQFDSYAEFTVWRLSGYFTTAHNNGAMGYEKGHPRPLPFYVLKPYWEFPLVEHSPFGYEQLTGYKIEEQHMAMLANHGTDELNNEGGMFQPTLDLGLAGGLLYWLGYGAVSQLLYRRFVRGTLLGITLYPIFYMALLETPLILFLCHPRIFPALVTLVAVAAHVTWALSSPRETQPASELLNRVHAGESSLAAGERN